MALEIEKKFLVDIQRWSTLEKKEPTEIQQGFIYADKEKAIRIRIYGEEAFLTIKYGKSMTTRNEFEYTIPVSEAKTMLEDICGDLIVKNRYTVKLKDCIWEVDEFFGSNEGLIIAEIELESEDQKIEIPEWVREEVTKNPCYLNSNLAKNPYKNWKEKGSC
jgi:adenylate cyclase